MSDFSTIALIAGAAALASPLGGLLALWRTPTTMFMSCVLGFASGVLLATICFEMLPQARELGSLALAVGGFVLGFALVYGFDLFVHRGQLAGEGAEQRPQVVLPDHHGPGTPGGPPPIPAVRRAGHGHRVHGHFRPFRISLTVQSAANRKHRVSVGAFLGVMHR